MLGERPVTLEHHRRRVTISEGLGVEWQSGGHHAAKFGIHVEAEEQPSHTQLRIDTPKAQGWIRLVCDAGEDPERRILGLRVGLRIGSKRHARTETLKVTLSQVIEGRYVGIDGGAGILKVETGVWSEIRALVDCRAVQGPIGLLVNLPKDCEIQLLSCDTEWLDLKAASSDTPSDGAAAAGGPDSPGAGLVFLAPFTVSRSAGAGAAEILSGPTVYGAGLELRGLELCGWVVGKGIDRARLRSGSEALSVTCDTSLEGKNGLVIPSGFRVATADLAGLGGLDILLEAEGMAHQELAGLRLPGSVLQEMKRQQRYRKTGRNKLFFYPDYTETNPYQFLMYQNMPQTEAAPGDIDAALEALESSGSEVVFHLHWLNRIYGGSETELQAEQKIRSFLKKLAHFVSQGGVLIWTVHNTFSHDPVFRDAEIRLAQKVADLARCIHLHSRTLLAELSAHYDLPAEKLLIEPHPNFIGTYPDYVSRKTARDSFGFPEDAKVFVFIGQIRPYKGVEELIWSFVKLREREPNAHLLIVGKPVHPYGGGYLQRKYGSIDNLRIVEGHIPNDRLQWYYRAADWVVLPYRNILTSGSLLCAQSFAAPVIAPEMGMISDVLEDGKNGILYDPEDETGLGTALLRAAEVPPEERRAFSQAALEAVRPLTWDRMGAGLERAIAQGPEFRGIAIAFDDAERECLLMGPSFPPERPARTAVVILNYEHLEDVLRLIGSLEASRTQDFDIYVVDNFSPTLTEYDLHMALPRVRLLRLPENLGYAAGNNAALRLIADVDHEFVWILNPDMVVSPDALTRHVAAAEAHPGHDIFGAVILKGGNSQEIASAGGFLSLDSGVSTGHMFNGNDPDVLPKSPYEVDFITGASVFLRKSVLAEIGLIPEDYFLYFEETHWLLEAKRKGKACLVLPDIHLAHHKRSEEGGLPAKYYFYYYLRNSLLFSERMSPGKVQATLSRLKASFLNIWLERIKQRAPRSLDAYRELANRGIADGLAGRAGKVDLIGIELSAGRKRDDAGAPPCEMSVTVTPSGMISGTIRSDRPTHSVAIVSGTEVIGQTESTRSASGSEFQFQLPQSFLTGAPESLEFYVDGAWVKDAGCKVLLPQQPPAYKGRIDGLRQYICSGWLWNTSACGEPLPYELVHDGKVIASGLADMFRPDLKRNGVSDGYAGFQVRLPRRFSDGKRHEIELRLPGDSTPLFKREVQDGDVRGGLAPRPPERELEAFFYHRHGWIGTHAWEDLPIGRFMAWSRAALAKRHLGRNADIPVSVIMPVFNRAGTVIQSIESVRRQTHGNWELVIVDDGSSDDSVAVIEAHVAETGDDRIRLLALPENRGVSGARNAGVEAATGHAIAYLDSDNVWLPDFLSIMLGELLDNPGKASSAYCGQNILHVLGSGETEEEELIAVRFGEFFLPLLENRNYIDLNCYVHTREAWQRLGGFDESLRRLVDWELILRHARDRPPHYVPALLSNYYFDKASNQITALEDYKSNFSRFRTLSGQHRSRAPGPDAASQPVDIVWVPQEQREGFAGRCRELLFTLGDDTRLLVFCPPHEAEDLAALAPGDPRLQVHPLDAPGEGRPGTSPELAALGAAFGMRRPDADMVYLHARAQPEVGWLDAFGRAARRVPEAGILISRHVVPGSDQRARQRAPFAVPSMETCIAISAGSKNMVDPVLAADTGIAEISGFDPFCVLMRRDLLENWSGAQDAEGGELGSFLSELQTFARQSQNRKTVYCAEVIIREL